MSGDEACIRACLDALNGKVQKEVIVMRYVRGYSWAKISARMGTDSTARDWHTRAMERLGEVLEELPEAGGAGPSRVARAYIISGKKFWPVRRG